MGTESISSSPDHSQAEESSMVKKRVLCLSLACWWLQMHKWLYLNVLAHLVTSRMWTTYMHRQVCTWL